jgi:hypothetical protein
MTGHLPGQLAGQTASLDQMLVGKKKQAFALKMNENHRESKLFHRNL